MKLAIGRLSFLGQRRDRMHGLDHGDHLALLVGAGLVEDALQIGARGLGRDATFGGFARSVAEAATVASSIADILVGMAISWRRSCRTGLMAGIALSLFYMASAAVVTPSLWLEPLGALVKTAPAIVLMLVALAILDER